MKHLQDVGRWGHIDDRAGDDLVHRFMVRGVGWVMHEAGAAAVYVYFRE